jgi:hypothetical protein
MLRSKFEIIFTRVAARFACALLLIAGSLVLTTSAHAQVTFGGGGGANVCEDDTRGITFGGGIDQDDCAQGTNVGQAQGIYFGSVETFNAVTSIDLNGVATFGAAATFNAGITVTGGTISLGNNRVQNVADPTADTDAANKRYVDQENATQQTQIDDNTTRITAAEDVNTAQQAQINQHTNDISTIQTVNANQQLQINQNTATNNTQAIDIAALQGAVGNLNSTADRLQTQIDQLDRRDDDLAEGIAISLALDQPFFHAGQTFAINLGWGGYDGQNAVGLTAAGIIDRGGLGPTSTTTLHGGVGAGTGNGQVAGKAGLSFGW